MERVAQHAGITKGGMCLYFRNKAPLVLATVEKTAAEMARNIERRVKSRSETWEILCELIRP